MTIFRFSAVLACLFLGPASGGAARSADPQQGGSELEDCSKFAAEGYVAEYQCVGRNNTRKERRLGEALIDAQTYLEGRQNNSTVMQDNRRSPIYLDWSQTAWKQYVDQNCTVVAGASGGTSAWVSRYWLDCYSEELDRRIKFLDELGAGQIYDR